MTRTIHWLSSVLNTGKWAAVLALVTAYSLQKDAFLRTLARTVRWGDLDSPRNFRNPGQKNADKLLETAGPSLRPRPRRCREYDETLDSGRHRPGAYQGKTRSHIQGTATAVCLLVDRLAFFLKESRMEGSGISPLSTAPTRANFLSRCEKRWVGVWPGRTVSGRQRSVRPAIAVLHVPTGGGWTSIHPG